MDIMQQLMDVDKKRGNKKEWNSFNDFIMREFLSR